MSDIACSEKALKPSIYSTTQREPLDTVTVTPLDRVTGPDDIALSVDGIVKLVPIVLLLVTIPLLARWIGAVWVVPSKVRLAD
jgi:hypothetical protein